MQKTDIPNNFYKNNLEFFPKQIDLFGDKQIDKSMIGRLGFLPSSLWKPNINITKELKEIINDNAQVRPTLNAHRSDRKHGVNKERCSIFNPHLAQMILSAYCPLNARIYDAFGGGGTRGYVATKMGHKYMGIEIRKEEVERLKEQMRKWNLYFDMFLGDSRKYNPKGSFNFAFTCPPYYDLELYSNLEGDLSNAKNYQDYLRMLKDVMQIIYNSLEKDCFSVFVVGNFRDIKGELEHLNGDLIRMGKEIGFKLWDEIIWMGASNVALTRCGQFGINRKSVRMHEYIVVLKK